MNNDMLGKQAHSLPWSILDCPLLLVFEKKEKKKMLFLDDRTNRIHSALRQFSEKWDVTLATNVKECLRRLSGEDFDEVRLDHDLGGDDFQDPDSPLVGMEIIRYLEKTGWPEGKHRPLFRVHSSNIFAAHMMVKRLQAMGFFAFWERFEYDAEAK
jgi:hypothetical protein